MNLYIDCEFDAVRVGRTHHQCVVSIGAITRNDKGSEQQSFYTLIKPNNFKRVTRVVAKMTQLGNDEILKARSFAMVMNAFESWIHKRCANQELNLYSFGPDDKRTILSHAKYENYTNLNRILQIQDLQKILSQSVLYHKQVISMTLSLDDLKYVYEIEGEVIHNALNDALDLMRIHQAYLDGVLPNPLRCEEIWKRKEAKRIEVKEKQLLKMVQLMKERYGKYNEAQYHLELKEEVVKQLEFLEDLQHCFNMQFDEEGVTIRLQYIKYPDIRLCITWHVEQIRPYVEVLFTSKEDSFAYALELNYRSSSILESICEPELEKSEQ